MRQLVLTAAMSLATTSALAAKIDRNITELPWKNGPTPTALYKFGEKSNTVHVIEAFSISCSWCNKNADQVKALQADYVSEKRVQFVDLGLDARAADYTRWISSHRPNYPVVQDLGLKVWNQLKQDNGIPQTFVIDCKGELVGSTVGYWGEEEKNTLKEALAKAFETSCE
jgi:Redoxin